jgi:hypothetical protein
MTIVSKGGATMKKPCLIALAMLLVVLSAAVCQASDAQGDTYRPVENPMSYDGDDEAYGGSIRRGNMRFHHLSVEICVDPKTMGNTGLGNFYDETCGTCTKMGAVILYNVDW